MIEKSFLTLIFEVFSAVMVLIVFYWIIADQVFAWYKQKIKGRNPTLAECQRQKRILFFCGFCPSDRELWYYRANVHAKLGEFDKAERFFLRYVERSGPDNLQESIVLCRKFSEMAREADHDWWARRFVNIRTGLIRQLENYVSDQLDSEKK